MRSAYDVVIRPIISEQSMDKAAYDQNYECAFASESGSLLTWDMINAASLGTENMFENELPDGFLDALPEDAEVTCGYACDLLSWVMSHGDSGMAWTTVQTNMNVVAVAVLADMACIVLPEDIEMEKEVLDKAVGEGIVVLTSPLTSYEISGRMYGQGIPAHN